MPDTSNFLTVKNSFYRNSKTYILEGIADPAKTIISSAYDQISSYFSDNTFRNTLTTPRKNNIESQISNVISQFDQIISLRNSNTDTAQFSQSVENFSNTIQSYLEEINIRFTIPYQLYLLQGNNDAISYISDLQTKAAEADSIKDQISTTLQTAQLLTGRSSAIQLADYYQELANGRNSVENESMKNNKLIILPKKIILYPLSAGIILLLFSNSLIDFYNFLVQNNFFTAIRIIAIVVILFGIVLPYIIRAFLHIWPGGYERSATIWFSITIFSVILTAIYSAVLINELGINTGWETIIPKIITLLAPAYFIRFAVQNYKANKHLAVLNTHKAVVAKVGEAFSKLISTNIESLRGEELKLRSIIVEKAASVVFEPTASGFITTKEGAGASGESMFDGLSSSIENRIK